MCIDDATKTILRLLELAVRKRDPSQSELEVRKELGCRQESLDAVPLRAGRIQHERRGGPYRSVFLTDPFVFGRLLLHVQAHGNELLLHELLDTRVRPHLSFQLSAASSHRCGREVEQDRPVLLLRPLELSVEIVTPRDTHYILLRCFLDDCVRVACRLSPSAAAARARAHASAGSSPPRRCRAPGV